MDNAKLFPLGISLATGTQAEDFKRDNCLRRDNPQRQKAELTLVTDRARDDYFIQRGEKVFAGTHLIIEVVNGNGVDECGATLLHIYTHRFSPQGVSGVAILA